MDATTRCIITIVELGLIFGLGVVLGVTLPDSHVPIVNAWQAIIILISWPIFYHLLTCINPKKKSGDA